MDCIGLTPHSSKASVSFHTPIIDRLKPCCCGLLVELNYRPFTGIGNPNLVPWLVSRTASKCNFVCIHQQGSGRAGIGDAITLLTLAIRSARYLVDPRLSGVPCHFVALRPFTVSNRPPSYQASTNEPESNRHFLCWWPVDCRSRTGELTIADGHR